MIRITYLFAYYLTIFLISFATAVIIIAAHPKTAPFLAEKLLKDNAVSYSRIEGSLLNGITLYDINYENAVTIKRLELAYDLPMLFKPTPAFKRVKTVDTSIILDRLPEEKAGNNSFFIPAFELSELRFENTRLIADQQMFSFDLNASQIIYRQRLNVQRLALSSVSSYGDIKAQGHIESDRLYAKSSFSPKTSLIEAHLSTLEGLEQTLDIELEADMDEVAMQTHIEGVSLKDHNASLSNADLSLRYLIREDHFDFNGRYGLSYDAYAAQVEQSALFTSAGDYRTDLDATLMHSPLALPFKSLHASASGDTKSMSARLGMGSITFDITTQTYEDFDIHAASKGFSLAFIPGLPDLFSKNSIRLNADARIHTAPFSVEGGFDAEGLYNTYKGDFELYTDAQYLLARLTPKPASQLWADYPVERFVPLDLIYYNDSEQGILNMDAGLLNLTLFKSDTDLNGWGNIGSSYFDTHGKITQENDTHLALRLDIPSVHTLMSELGFNSPEDGVAFDARADINASMKFSDDIRVKSRIHLPWYSFQADTQTSYQGEDIYLESTLVNEKITVDRYDLNVKGHHIYSKRPSEIAFDANGSILIEEFWVYDNLLVSGIINPSQAEGRLHLQSERFNYDSKEGNITLKADITADFESSGKQNIEGEITLLDGVITYEPKTDFTISDNVIIIQDIKPRSKFKRSVNIHINAVKPINYKVKDIDIRFIPDLILWQESDTPLAIYGLLSIEDGQVTGGGRVFEFDKSEVYFNGSSPLNPHLNLNLHHQTLDDIDIQIYITNTLSSPVVILASTPPMSQDDIMSYILFAEPASSAFSSSTEGSKTISVSSLLLATGLKQIFNDTTGIKIDTLNILTNEEGTLGYEIGTRFNKDIRVLYKNDTVSSVILQYRLSRSIRLDVDVHETGQGVTILYVKDF